MALRLCLGLTAQPDVQLQLVNVKAGSEARPRPANGRSRFPKADSTSLQLLEKLCNQAV